MELFSILTLFFYDTSLLLWRLNKTCAQGNTEIDVTISFTEVPAAHYEQDLFVGSF